MYQGSFISIISYDPSVPFNVFLLVLVSIMISSLSIAGGILILVIVFLPLNSYILLPIVSESLSISLLLFIFLEIMLFLAYFWYYFHNLSVSTNVSGLSSGEYYFLAGLLLSLLSIYLSLVPLVIFIVLSFTEFSNVLDLMYINDNSFLSLQLTIIFLHLLHLLVGIIFILCELSYPHYYHFIEILWLLIGYCIYLS
jgi:heme/copper-type cytochrome/quinol oxidase subunit 3